MFDTHTHLNFPDAYPDLSAIISAAHTAGVTHMLVPGTDLTSSEKAIEIAQMDSNIYAGVGIHPSDVTECLPDTLEKLEALVLSSEKVVAIGEIGLDYYWIFKTVGGDKAQKPARDEVFAVQKEYFLAQLNLAIKHKKTVVIHCRQAKKPLLEVLNEQWDAAFTGKMVFHCCEPDMDLLNFALSHDVYIGFDGDLTYNQEKQAFIQNVPMERIVIETDAPFLTPEPIRQTQKFPNEPAHVTYVADAVAQFKGISREEVIMRTMENSLELFSLK
jgi:TatD DNase family protein